MAKMQHSIVLALIAIFLWSTLAALGKQLAHIPPFLLVGVTLGIGSLLSIGKWRTWFSRPWLLIFGTAGIFGYHFLLFTAFRNAPVIEANLINYLWPVLIVVFSGLFLKNYKLRLQHAVGGAIAFFGASLVLTGGGFNFKGENFSGYLLAFSAAVTWALYSVFTKKIRHFSTSMVGGFCFISSLAALVCHALFEPSAMISISDGAFLFALGIGPMGLAFYAWDGALKKGDPRTIGALSYLTPLLSTLLLSVTGGEPFGITGTIALICIVGGAVISVK